MRSDSLEAITPGYAADQVLARVDAAFEMVAGMFPVPRDWRCVCGSRDGQLQRITYGRHDGTVRERADVSVKCCVCSRLEVYGVPVPREVWERAATVSRAWEWHAIKSFVDQLEERET